MRNFVLKGNICFCDEEKKLQIREKAWVVCEDGICRGVFDRLPEAYRNFEVKDMKEQLILPALTDLHTHAPQYAFRGLGMDLELLDSAGYPYVSGGSEVCGSLLCRKSISHLHGRFKEKCGDQSGDLRNASCGGHRDSDGSAGGDRSGDNGGEGKYGSKRRKRSGGEGCGFLSRRDQKVASGDSGEIPPYLSDPDAPVYSILLWRTDGRAERDPERDGASGTVSSF